MNILTIDTSAKRLLVVVDKGGNLFTEKGNEELKKHNSALLPYIDRALSNAGITVRDIDCFCAVVGPGSFTGIRVGVSAINGLAYALDKPVAGINSLFISMYGLKDSPLLSVMDAGHGNCYFAQFDESNKLTFGIKTELEVQKFDGKVVFYDENYEPEKLADFARIVAKNIIKDGVKGQLEPVYLRKSQAERVADGEE